ncbi:MAG: sigma-70 family RNA polymerase sigma factor [Bacteroidetes bacterium]|nr:sigma-70 family RNA polymerase sigma factor [Bacteroidota bacterium]
MNEEYYLKASVKDPKAFKYFYDLYFKSIFLFIFRRTDDEALSEDITQQVFLIALQNIKKFEYRGIKFSSWLYRIALSELAKYYRDNKKIRVVSLESKDIAELIEDDSIAFERNTIVFKILKQLPQKELEFIEMRFFEKRSFSEIAEIKNISENNAKVKVHRILNSIRKLIPAKHFHDYE